MYSGAFNWREKLKLSVKLNLRFYVVALVVVLLAIIILLAQGALAAADLLPLLISLSNTYGLLLVCIMMGYGLYTIPFSVRFQLKAPKVMTLYTAEFRRCGAPLILLQSSSGPL